MIFIQKLTVSLQKRIFLMLLACVALCAVMLSLLADIEFRNRGPAMFHHGSLRFFAAEFERLWQEKKIDEIQSQLSHLSEIQNSDFQWLDRNGKDLLGNQNHPEIRSVWDDEPHKRGGPRGRRFQRDNRIRPIQSNEPGRQGFLAFSPSGEFAMVHWVPPPQPWPAMPLFLSITTILLIFGILISRSIGTPITKLSQTMESFGEGDFSARSAIRRSDEIGQLATSFNAMASRIETDFNRERRMVRNIAHEVRTPLTRMLLLLERIRSGRYSEKAIEQMESEIQQLSMMPEKLIELSDIEQGRAKISLQQVDAIAFLENSIERMQLIASKKNCHLTFEFNGRLITYDNSSAEENEFEIQTDPDLLARAIENIIDNAIRHSPDNFEIRLNCNLSENRTLTIEVQDSGTGVPEEDLTRIFTPFFMSDLSRNQNSGGLGLGLSISRSIVNALNGSIEARNTNPGLALRITLPA
jgi:signal transduction histidine kinase